jgi:hypothetical protein
MAKSSKSGKDQSKSRKDQSKGPSLGELTPAELAALDFLIKDMEERGGTSTDIGFLPGIIAGFVVRRAAVWLLENAFKYIILRAILRSEANIGELSETEMREAEKLLQTTPSPTLEDLKKVRRLLKEKKSR